MNIAIGKHQVNLCSAPAFMGHEEIVLPMLVLGSLGCDEPDNLGEIRHCLNPTFQPNDLSNTAIAGFSAGYPPGDHRGGVNLERFFVGRWNHELKSVPEVSAALDGLGLAYAFWCETSVDPFHDGFVRRCRFVHQDRLSDFHPGLDVRRETAQVAKAEDVLDAFLDEHSGIPDYRLVYGDYYSSRDFRGRFGDDEQFDGGYAVWLEQEGVVRAWTRITYVPK